MNPFSLASLFSADKIAALMLRAGLLFGLALLARWIFMAFQHMVIHWKEWVLPTLVHLGFYGLLVGLFLGLVLTPLGLRCGFGGLWSRFLGRLFTVSGVTLINSLVLLIRLFVVAISPGDTLRGCSDAITTWIERQTDLLFRPMR